MDWSNENYVRLYTRETEDDLMLSWEARALWKELLCKFDRAGLLPLKRGPRGLAAMLRWPAEVVERALPELLEDGRLRAIESGLFAPNFLGAQEAKSSDAQRKREERERRRANAVSAQDVDRPVTKRDGAVTKRDQLSEVDEGPDKKSLLLSSASSAPQEEALSRAHAHDPTTVHGTGARGPLPPEPLGDRDPEPARTPAPIASAPPPARVRLNVEAWNYAATTHALLRAEGIPGDVAFPLQAFGEPMRELATRVRELLGEDAEPDYEAARAKLRHRVDVAAAEARRADVGHLRWFTPSKLWDAKSFARALEVSPAEAARPRAGPASSGRFGDRHGAEVEPPRRIKTL